MNCHYIEFEISDEERFAALESVFAEIKRDKDRGKLRDVDEWKCLFDARALNHFWWPSQAERENWKQQFFSTPYPQRFTDPSLARPWDFASLFDAFSNGDYQLVGLSRVSQKLCRLEFEPFGLPYGGTGCIRALIEAFDHKVTGESD